MARADVEFDDESSGARSGGVGGRRRSTTRWRGHWRSGVGDGGAPVVLELRRVHGEVRTTTAVAMVVVERLGDGCREQGNCNGGGELGQLRRAILAR